VMAVASVVAHHVQVYQAASRDGAPKFFRQRRVERTKHFRLKLHVPDADCPAAQIKRGGNERLVHRQGRRAVPGNARFIAERLRQGLAKTDADVLHRVVGIDVQVALGVDVEIDQAVAGEQVEHVVEETQTRGKLGRAGTVEVDAEGDFRFTGFAPD